MICPHGIECINVYRIRVIDGEEYYAGSDLWHDEDERCDA